MSLNIREFSLEKDAEDVVEWWKKQGWDENTIHVVSDAGFIAEDGEKLAAAWVIKTNTPIYMIEWTVGNPNADWEKRKDALEQLTNHACDWAKQDGAKAVMVMTKSDRYIEKLKNTGFIESDNELTHLIRSL